MRGIFVLRNGGASGASADQERIILIMFIRKKNGINFFPDEDATILSFLMKAPSKHSR